MQNAAGRRRSFQKNQLKLFKSFSENLKKSPPDQALQMMALTANPSRQIPLPFPASFRRIARMFKKLILGAGALVLGMNVAMVFCPDTTGKMGVEIFSAACGLAIMFLASRLGAPAAPAKSSEPIPPPPTVRPEAEIVAFLALLQEHGRLVDFIREEIAGASDQQVGSAARVVHAGCRKVLEEYLDIQALREGNEGDRVVLESGYDAAAHRLLGSVPNQPPYKGKLMHPGWIARSVKLPRVTGVTEQRPWPVLAPAEVELT